MLDFCKDHLCIKTKIDELTFNRRFWYQILDSKWFFWVVTGTIILWLGFGGWVVREIYAQKANDKENRKVIETVSESTKETKQDVKEIKEEIKRDQKERVEQREKDQETLMRILLEIKREVKK